MKNKTLIDALDNALSALYILANKECSEKINKTLKENCEERKKRFTESFDFLKVYKSKIEGRQNILKGKNEK